MKTCLKCSTENPQEANYCRHCGSKLEELKACTNPDCLEHGKYVLPLSTKFCPNCGKKIANQIETIQNELIPKESSTQPYGHSLSRVGRQLDIKYKVKEIIADKLGVNISQVKDDANFAMDLNADSLDTVELIMAFEEEFGIVIPDEDTQRIASVKDAIYYIQKKCL